MLIGIHGKAKTGKDTAASHLVENYGFVRHAFADALKQTAATMFGVSIECFTNENLKDRFNSYWGISYREMLQKLGTECARDVFHQDFWIRRCAKAVHADLNSDACAGVVISDVRFENEADWVRKAGGVVLHLKVSPLKRRITTVREHISEKTLPRLEGDYLIRNDGTISDLYAALDSFMLEMREREDAKRPHIARQCDTRS